MNARTAEIKLTVDLDGENLPTRIEWQASEAGTAEPQLCQSMMLALWDDEKQSTASIDLWTRDMTVAEMNLHFYQVFRKMADSYLRATKNNEGAKLIREFSDSFGKTLGLS
jgi:gliding motility-associated protein GldC